MAAVLACGPRAALSHRSAADLWGLRPNSTHIEVTVSRGRGGPRDVRDSQDFTTQEQIPVTTVARTLLDLAGVIPRRDLARATDRAERLELFDLAAVEEVLSRARGMHGAATLRRVIADYRSLDTQSELEDRFAELVRTAGLPAPEYNALLDGEQATHQVDTFWPAHRLVVELDGCAFHRTPADLKRDAATQADLELAGYRVLRLTWDDVVVHGSRTTRRLRQLLT